MLDFVIVSDGVVCILEIGESNISNKSDGNYRLGF